MVDQSSLAGTMHIYPKYTDQGSGNFEIWIGPADDDDVINGPISKKKKKKKFMYRSPLTKTNDNLQSYNSF